MAYKIIVTPKQEKELKAIGAWNESNMIVGKKIEENSCIICFSSPCCCRFANDPQAGSHIPRNNNRK